MVKVMLFILSVNCYKDSDWARLMNDQKSITRYMFNLGTGAVSWVGKK